MRSEPADLTPARQAEFVDILERILAKGIVIETEVSAGEGSEKRGDAPAWHRVSIGGVDVLRVEATSAWRYLFETDQAA
jgi:hypothetical protein